MAPITGEARSPLSPAEEALLRLHPLGSTELLVTPLCVGTSPFGSMPRNYGYEVSVGQAVATVRAVLAGPISFIDTSNNYGAGQSERAIGIGLREVGGLPEGFVLATKVDPDPRTGDFSGARVRTSVQESLERLGVERLQLLYFHDPEQIPFDQAIASGGPVEALTALRDEGVVDHLGVAGGPVDLMRRYIATGHFAAVITHNRWTLVDRSAGPLLEDAARRGVAVVNGAPYGGGILVKGPDIQANYGYRRPSETTLRRIREMQGVCARHDVPLAAAALQFSLRQPLIASTIVGMSDPSRIQQTLDLATHPIPDGLWRELEPLVAPEEDWLG